MIKVNNLSKEFHEQGTSNELLAVDHVDFTIQNGSFCALVGESGSGKSTLAQLMCGLLVPSSGEVLFEGKNISLCRGKQKQVLRSKIQLILQDGKGAMDPRFTVAEAIKPLHKADGMSASLLRMVIPFVASDGHAVVTGKAFFPAGGKQLFTAAAQELLQIHCGGALFLFFGEMNIA